jgi:hypothetical protein
MAKRRVKAGTRKAGRKTSKKATRKASRPGRRSSAQKAKSRQSLGKSGGRRRTARPKARARKTARLRASGASARRATAGKSARQASKRSLRVRKSASTRRASASARGASTRKTASKRPRLSTSRPKPVALSRERRQLREDEGIPGAPSTLNFAVKASAAESGHQMYHQRAKEHTEGGQALTGGDVDSDWNDAYASGEETPGGDMSTPDQDVVEEIGRALGVEYEDAEELKGAEKIESRDRNRWEYDPASAEDYKDRNRRDD